MIVSNGRQEGTVHFLPNQRSGVSNVLLCANSSSNHQVSSSSSSLIRNDYPKCSQRNQSSSASSCDIRHWQRKCSTHKSSFAVISTCCSLTRLISVQFIGKKMLFLLLFIMACLMDTSKTKKFNLDDYMQMVQHKQPATYQRHLLAAYNKQTDTGVRQLTHYHHQQQQSNDGSRASAPVSHKQLQPIVVDYHQSSTHQVGGPSMSSSSSSSSLSSLMPRLTLLNSQVPLTRYHRHLKNHTTTTNQHHPQLQEANEEINSSSNTDINNNQGHSHKSSFPQSIASTSNNNELQSTRVTVNYQNHQQQNQNYLPSDHQHHQSSEFNRQNDKQLNLKLTDSVHHLNERMATAESSTTYRTNSLPALAPSTAPMSSSQQQLDSSNTSSQQQQQLASQSPQIAPPRPNNDRGGGGDVGENKTPSSSGGGGGGGQSTTNNGPVAMASSLAGAIENPLGHFLDPSTTLDFMHSTSAGSDPSAGHYDYAYQAPPPAPLPPPPVAATQFAIATLPHPHHYPHLDSSVATNSTMALYRLLNLIDQQQTSTPAFGGGSKLSYSPFDNPYHYQTIGGGGSNNNKSSSLYNYYHAPSAHHQHQHQHQHHHHQLASQTSSSSMPNHWSSAATRKRANNPLAHWPTAAAAAVAADKHPFDNSNLIDVQPPSSALKLLKSSSSLYMPTGGGGGGVGSHYHLAGARKNHSHMNLQAAAAPPHQHHRSSYYSYNHNHNYNHQPYNHERGLHNGSSSSSSANNNNNFNNNFNSLLNNEDIGFGNKYSPTMSPVPLAPSSSLPPPQSSSSSSSPSSTSQREREREREREQREPLNNNNNNNNNSNNNSEKLSGALTSSSLANSRVPHDADSEMIAANNAPRCDKFTPDICVDDFEYPEQAIIDEIQKKRDVFELMYSEVKDNEPLVDGIPRDVEESYNYDYYYYGKTNLTQAASGQSVSQLTLNTAAASSQQQQQLPTTTSSSTPSVGLDAPTTNGLRHRSRVVPMLTATSSSSSGGSTTDTLDGSLAARASSPPVATAAIDGMDALIGTAPQATAPVASSQSPPTTGYICPSEVMYGKPKLAKNKKGLWKVIVNAGEFTQTVRLEKCLFPNKKCNYVSAHSYESRCAQVHSYHRLLVFEKGRGFYIDTFRLPTGCNCYVSKKPFSSAASSTSGSSSSTASAATTTLQQTSNRRDSSSSSFQDGAQSSANFNEVNNNNNGRANRLPALLGDSSFNPHQSYGGDRHRDSSSSSGGGSSQSMLSQTLWSILAGGGSGGNAGSSGGGGSHPGGENPFNYYNNQNNNNNNYESASSDNGNSNGYHSAPGGGGGSTQYPHQDRDRHYNSEGRPSGGGGGGGQREAYQSQSLILEHLSQNPSLAANISNSVLRQLIDVGQISASSTTSQSSTASAAAAAAAAAASAAHQHQQHQQMLSGQSNNSGGRHAPPPPPLPAIPNGQPF